MSGKEFVIIVGFVVLFGSIILRIIKDKKDGKKCSSCNCIDFQIALEKIRQEKN